ncbi:hypothetical protein [Enterobacter sp. HPCN14]|nr:hypothetical protein [Enterobacter sp. HPCN14]
MNIRQHFRLGYDYDVRDAFALTKQHDGASRLMDDMHRGGYLM